MGRIGQLLPGRPVTGLDIGCGTGRYTRLLRGLLPDGSLLAAADVSAAMLAQLKAATAAPPSGWSRCWRPPKSCRCGPPASTWSPRSTAFTTSTSARFLAAAARVLAPGGQLFIYTRTPQQNARTIWGRYFPGFTEHEQRLHSEAAFRDAVRRTDGLTVAATQTFRHPRTSTAERLGPRPRGATTRHSPSIRRRSCARPSRRSWPGCPAPRSPGLRSTCWSSSAGAAAARWSLTVQPAWRTRRSGIRPSRSAPGAPVRLPAGVLAAARRSPRSVLQQPRVDRRL